jgi:protein-S-isoprenylcysteine O-methyltransferase Ste14
MDFKTKTIKQIRLWVWAAAVLPITGLAGIFFVWNFGTNHWISIAMIVGETIMFAGAVIWWWWSMFTMRNIVEHWGDTKDKVQNVLTEVKEIRAMIGETLKEDK